MTKTSVEHGPGRLALASWCLYDWATQGFPTIIITFVFATYFTKVVAPDPVTGTELWGNALSASALLVAISSPLLGAIADQIGRQKPWLLASTVVCVAAVALLWFTRGDPSSMLWALAFVAIGNVAFETAMVFYNAMLPNLAPRGKIGRLSGWGWGLGYAGGVMLLVLSLTAFVQADRPALGLDTEAWEHVRATPLLVAAWMAVFSIPLFLFTPDGQATGVGLAAAARGGLRTLIATLRRIRSYRQIALYLFARMIYTDGLNTLFIFGGIYAAGQFGMALDEIVLFGIALNVTAGLGAAAFAWVDDWIGAKRTILISVAAIIVLAVGLLLVEEKAWFWFLGAPIGIFFGPAQSASRSFMARLAPKHLRTEMFGLYAFSGKATAFLGPFVVATVTGWTGSQRAGMATILVFLVAGMALLLPVRDVRE
ncbi:MAG: MFS transporter [Rhodospirillales bacterium]|nr:MFS transporter [Rhodospirillales bacterium]